MRPCLCELEPRLMMDTALANAFLTQLAPVMVQTVQLQEAHYERETAFILGVATAQAQALGPQFAATNLPPLVDAVQALQATGPQLQMATLGLVAGDYQLLLSFPPGSGELAAIADTVMILTQLDTSIPTVV